LNSFQYSWNCGELYQSLEAMTSGKSSASANFYWLYCGRFWFLFGVDAALDPPPVAAETLRRFDIAFVVATGSS
jgi:hypothetical protein